jgi:DNA-directed RNA polymerase specialized sigma24 family protein
MGRILVERARQNHAGDRRRITLEEAEIGTNASPERVLAIREALDRLTEEDAQAADVVRLHYFAGLGEAKVAESLGLGERTEGAGTPRRHPMRRRGSISVDP